MHESHCQWVLAAPVFASILTSLLFLMNVMRVLLTKLHRNSANPAPIGVRKAARAALILVPLFGIHYILIPYRPKHKTAIEIAYQVFSVVLVSTQVRQRFVVEGHSSGFLWATSVFRISISSALFRRDYFDSYQKCVWIVHENPTPQISTWKTTYLEPKYVRCMYVCVCM